MTDKLEQHMTRVRDISLSASEMDVMRRRLMAYAHVYRPALRMRAFSWVARHGALSTALALILVLGGTSVSASMAKPNDVLYGFRLHVNDQVESALAFDEEAKMNVEARQLERQLNDEDGVREESLVEITSDERHDTESESREHPASVSQGFRQPENRQQEQKKDDNNGSKKVRANSYEHWQEYGRDSGPEGGND